MEELLSLNNLLKHYNTAMHYDTHLYFQLLGKQSWGRLQFEAGLSKNYSDSSSTNTLRMVVCVCHPNYAENANMVITVQGDLGINKRPFQKITKAKKNRAEGVGQAEERLPRK
jgi:hypothetical protein